MTNDFVQNQPTSIPGTSIESVSEIPRPTFHSPNDATPTFKSQNFARPTQNSLNIGKPNFKSPNMARPLDLGPPKGSNSLQRPQINIMKEFLSLDPLTTTADYSDSDLILPENAADYDPFAIQENDSDEMLDLPQLTNMLFGQANRRKAVVLQPNFGNRFNIISTSN